MSKNSDESSPACMKLPSLSLHVGLCSCEGGEEEESIEAEDVQEVLAYLEPLARHSVITRPNA